MPYIDSTSCTLFEPRHEKPGFSHMRNCDKDADQLRGNREADQRL